MRVRYTETALAEIEEIFSYIAVDKAAAAAVTAGV
jgi:plasmid stabilization system protein ParE